MRGRRPPPLVLHRLDEQRDEDATDVLWCALVILVAAFAVMATFVCFFTGMRA